MRKAAAALGVVLLVLAILAALLPRLVSLDSLKPRIVATLEEKTGRKVDFRNISLSLFPGIGVKVENLVVSGDPPRPDEPLITVPEGEVRLAIAPLLLGRAEFTTFLLRRPKIHFHRFKDGTHSATDLANRLARREEPKPPAPAGPKEEEKVSVVLRTIAIEEGDLSLRFEETDGRETRWDLSPFSFRLSGIGDARNDFTLRTRIGGAVRGEVEFAGKAVREPRSVTDPTMFALSGEGKVFGQKVSAEGRMSAPQGALEVDLAVDLPKLRMEDLQGLFADPPPYLKEARPEGVGKLSAKIYGNLQSMGLEAEADLTGAGWSFPPGVRKLIDAPFVVVAQGHWLHDLLVLSNAEIRASPLLWIANGSYAPATGAREWAFSARISSLSEFGKGRGDALAKWSPSGRLTVSGKGRRSSGTAKESWNADADLGEAGFLVPGRRLEFRGVNGHVETGPESVEFTPLSGLANGQRFHLRGKVTRGPVPSGQLDIRMAYLDVDTLFPPAPEVGKNGKGGPPARKDDHPGKPGHEVSARAQVAIDAGVARGVEFRDLAGVARYEKGTLFLDSMRARLYGGEATVTGRISLGNGARDFRVKLAAKNLAAEQLLGSRTSLKDYISGAASLSMELGGSTRDFPDFARTASGAGALKVAGGKIRGVDLLGAAGRLSGIGPLPAAPGTGAETPFSDLSADFRISGGRIRTDTLRIVSDALGLSGAASVGFDRTLDFRGVLRLSKEASDRARGAAGQFLVAETGRVEIPLVMSGPLTSPAMAVDTEALAKGLAGRALRGLSGSVPSAGTAPSPGPPGKEPSPAPDRGKAVESLIERFLKGK